MYHYFFCVRILKIIEIHSFILFYLKLFLHASYFVDNRYRLSDREQVLIVSERLPVAVLEFRLHALLLT